MKTTRYLFLMLLITMFGMSAKAQQRNVLQVKDVTTQIGSLQLPVSIENTDEIVGIQFDITLPKGVTADNVGTMANRSDGHSVTVKLLSSGAYRVLLHSSQNRPLRGQSGTVMYLPINIPASFKEGSEHELSIANAVLGKSSGENVLTEVEVGKIHISRLPDLTVKNINCDNKTLNPGDRIVVSWQVENIGELSTGGGWSEQISLISEDETQSKLIATNHYDDILDASGIVSRQAEITLPNMLGIDGQVRLQVHILPDSDTGESTSAQGNNRQTGNNSIFINKVLTVELSPNRVEENSGKRIALKVSRSGNWTAAEVFSIVSTTDSRISVPTSITIPANQSGAIVYFNVMDNDVLDNDSIINVSIEGNGYDAVKTKLYVVDNEYPDLKIETSKSVLKEGETFQLKVKTSRVSDKPILVTLTSENAKRFKYPTQITIPAGEISQTVDIIAIDDDLPSLLLSNAFSVYADKHNRAEIVVLLEDDDMPALELTISPTQVSESAGPVSVAGILRRTTNTDKRITVHVTDDSNGRLYFGNREFVLEKGVEEVHFNFGPVDNAIVDGDLTCTITAAVWLSSCSCGASGESAGYVEAKLQVLDNDGPALNLASSLSTVKEGGKTNLTISRNTTDNAAPLTVTLNSDYEEGLSYEHTVIIPAGQQSTTVEVTSAGNSIQGDSHTVIFTVQAEGYAKGTCFVMVTDQTLPDARISSITADVTEAEVGTQVKLNIEVTNEGAAELPVEVPVKIYHRGESSAIATLYTPQALAIGESVQVSRTITLPTTVGNHSYYAVVNETNKVNELSYTNNTSVDAVVKVIAPFSVAVSTDKKIYQQGEKILITGQLTGNGTANTEVDLYVINEGARQVQTVVTDEHGQFVYEWQLYALQLGHFSIGACYPNEELKTEMASFDVYGLRRTSNDFITCETKLGEPYEGTITIENPGQFSQTITSFEVISKPDACDVVLDAPSVITANGTAQLKFKITGNAVTESTDWETVNIKLTTKEGASLSAVLYYYCAAHHAVLTTNPTSIKTTMTKGTTRDYLINVMNTGKGSTGKINVLIPDVEWMKLNTPSEMPSLEYGEATTISLQLTPTDKMNLNIPYTGSIALNCENGNGVSVSYNIEVVSETTGILNVDVVDEYTYYTEEKPHVSGAGIVVKHPVTGAIVAQGETGIDGIYRVELPEGYYSLTVTEDHHKSVTGNILIDPGSTNYQELFLSYNAITYSWDVVETEIEDEYKVETIAKYETNVPKPVVVINLPTERPSDGSIIPILVTNKGLINAQNVIMNLDCTDAYELELLNPEPVEILSPQQTYIFYAKFKKKPIDNSMQNAWGNPDVDCISIFAGALYDYMCGNAKNMEEALAQNGWGDCVGDGGPASAPVRRIKPLPTIKPDWPVNTPGTPIIIGPEPIKPTPTDDGPGILETLRQWYCSLPCGKELTQALACTAADKIIPDWLKCGYNIINTGLYGNWKHRLSALLDCAGLPNPFEDGCWTPYFRCMLDHYNIHFSRSFNRQLTASHDRGYETAKNFNESEELIRKEGNAYRRIAEEIFGGEEWLECDNHELSAILSYIDMKSSDYVFKISDLIPYKPQTITDNQLETLIERINNTNQYESIGYDDITNYINPDTVDFYSNIIDQCEDIAKNGGWENLGEMHSAAYDDMNDYLSDGNNSVCASVSIKISQTMVMTRQAFRGTLTVFNGNEEKAMQDVKLYLEVTKPLTGEVATSHEFQINTEKLDGFVGELDLNNGWMLDANATGTATILFIPTKYAAPEDPVEWSFGGTLSYIDPFTGLEVTRELYPVTLTVKPSPELDMDYFMQRDIYGDDPLTLDVVEPMKPAEFALLINNKGNGDATNVRMVTQQPEIIKNEKGVLAEFSLISSQINGEDANLSFGKSIANNFGTIPAHSQAYAQWWLQSSQLGHFTEYNVQANHVTSYGNEDLSLLDNVAIHELIHGFTVKSDGEEKIRGFLVNEISDSEDTPDSLFFTDATQQSVYKATNIVVNKINDLEYELKVDIDNVGWNYGNVLDPTSGKQKLVRVTRADGTDVNVDNIWQTDRILRDGKDWLYENRLHFIGNMSAEGETFYLTFEPTPTVELEVESYAGVPEEGTVLKEQLTTMSVKFNKPIKSETFTTEDITLNCQGITQDASQIVIEQVSEQEYKLLLNNVTLQDGYYVLTVQTADIMDTEGFNGTSGKQATWIQFIDGKVALKLIASPVEGGTVSPASGRFDYDSDVMLKATPAEGYEFSGWSLNDEFVTYSSEYAHHLTSDAELKALFLKKHYNVTISYDPIQGALEGAASGIYEYGTQLQLTAVPANGYDFDIWLMDNERDTNDNPYTLIVNRDMNINALFKEQTITDIQKVNTDALQVNIAPIPLGNNMHITGNFNRINQVGLFDMRGIKVFGTSNVQIDENIYVGNLPTGIYFIYVNTDRGIYRAKVVKQ